MNHVSSRSYIRADHYIAADKSDPFLSGRVAAHIRNGIAGYRVMFYRDDTAETKKLEPMTWITQENYGPVKLKPIRSEMDAFYSAEQATEERHTADGMPYVVAVYRSMVRP